MISIVIIIGTGNYIRTTMCYESVARDMKKDAQYQIDMIKDIPKEIHGENHVNKLVLKDNELQTDAVFILRECISPAQLVPGLKISENHIEVDRLMKTNLEGCFAAGDVVGAPYQYIKAAGEGNIASLSAISYLDKKSI